MDLSVLAEKSCNKYGATRQLVVAMEELSELSCAIAKFVRYRDEKEAAEQTREKVLDEYCDVMIVQANIAYIYGFTDDNIKSHLDAKAGRVLRWINSDDDSLEITLKDRAVLEKDSCDTCQGYRDPDYNICRACEMAQATEGINPFYKKKD